MLGLAEPLEVYRASRSGKFVEPWGRSDGVGYCPQHWADVKIGHGACGFRCRACFLMATHRIMANPARHVLYENTDKCLRTVKRWLQKPDRRSLGLGIDCSDSLLYEGVTGLARSIIPLVASPETNPKGVRLILLTKSTNDRYLAGLPTSKVVVSYSLNPEPIADLWEGKFTDGTRVTPPIADRVASSLRAAEMGFEVRWRVDPILTPPGWREQYVAFLQAAARKGARPTRITLGTYRENSPSLLTFAERWGLPPMEWIPPELSKEGMHGHVVKDERVGVYRQVIRTIRQAWRGTGHRPEVALCKETAGVRKAVGIDHDRCNCG